MTVRPSCVRFPTTMCASACAATWARCVTHLAQVAAHADAHIVVGKRTQDGRTGTEARLLGPDERTAELAAMLAGEGAGDEAQAAAEALLRAAR